jgi:mRNA interferase HicA
VKYREVEKKLRKLGCVEIIKGKGGSHRKWINPTANSGAPVPDWGSKDLKMGTLRAAVKQLGLDWEKFMSA